MKISRKPYKQKAKRRNHRKQSENSVNIKIGKQKKKKISATNIISRKMLYVKHKKKSNNK